MTSIDHTPFGAFAPSAMARAAIEMTRAMPDSWLGRRLAFALRQCVVTAMRGRPVDFEAFGANMRLFPYDNMCEKRLLFTPQYFDRGERSILMERMRPDLRFIDIGANVGAYSLFVAALAGGAARILAIEPQPDIFERLVANMRLNPFGTIKAVQCAVADKPGDFTLFLDTRNRGESSMRAVRSPNGLAMKVPATTLMQLVTEEKFERIDAIKLDVEGAEDLILEPFFHDASEALWPSLIIMEDGVGRWHTDMEPFLKARGYRQLLRTHVNYVFEHSGKAAGAT
ncbi:MAG: FkbM family methyltransferase [Hyphomicrobiales bacterium]|nr:FkbM family methyltransferase [Hyphomicrobiales bacterium]